MFEISDVLTPKAFTNSTDAKEKMQAEIWLEVVTDNIQAASAHLKSAGIVRCDEIEPLPKGMKAFWVSNPASVVHLFSQGSES